MYTVIRFIAEDEGALTQIGTEMNGRRPGSYDGLSLKGRQFSVSVSKDDHWGTQHSAILAFLTEFEDLIARTRALPGKVQIDTMIEPDDRGPNAVVSMYGYEGPAVEFLGRNGVGVVFSFVWPPSSDETV